jgi:hypothetical protein
MALPIPKAWELRVAQLAGKSEPLLKIVLSITLSMPVRSMYLLPCLGLQGFSLLAEIALALPRVRSAAAK